MYSCLICDNAINNEPKFMVAVEVPYLNLYVHKICYLETDITQELLGEMIKKYLLLIKNKK